MLLAAAVAGCAPESGHLDDSLSEPRLAMQPEARATAVVADIGGGGVNPYHPVFRRPDWAEHPSERILGFPADAPSLSLTFGDNVEANLAADAATWSSYKLGVVHWVAGTNLLLLTTRTPEGSAVWPASRSGYQLPGPGRRSHTLAPGASIPRTCTDCYLLVVQDIGS